MIKPYFNDAIIGNSRILACLSKEGEIIRLFWPNIDFAQNIETFHAGLIIPSVNPNAYWLHENSAWNHTQQYIKDTNILETVCTNNSIGLMVKQTDFVINGKDIVVRHYLIKNESSDTRHIKFVVYSSMISTESNLRSTVFNREVNALTHYSQDGYIAVSSDYKVENFQIGNVYDCARCGQLNGIEDVGMIGNGAVIYDIGEIGQGQSKEINIFICASHNYSKVLEEVTNIRNISIKSLIDTTANYWTSFLGKAKSITTSSEKINDIYKRTILTFALTSDEKYGGLLAAPEVDESFTRCGRYAFCYGRDAAFIAQALDRCNLTGISGKFYEWCFSTQLDDGSWHQRYYLNGNLAPSWGLQVDEVGAILWGIKQHFDTVKSHEFLNKAWKHVKKGAEFLIGFIDKETGLPNPTYDLWEERVGEHVFSASAVFAGLMAASEIAEELMQNQYRAIWKEEAEKIKKSIELYFQDSNLGRLRRSIRLRKNQWETINNDGDKLLGHVDNTVDVSLIGAAVPFGVFEPQQEIILNTAKAIEEKLTSPLVGGIKRYENDGYIGGNPWIIGSLWMALYYIRIGSFDKAKSHFNWAVEHTAMHNFLPEQIDRDSGQPAWITQLTWSHAMFVIVLLELLENGVEL